MAKVKQSRDYSYSLNVSINNNHLLVIMRILSIYYKATSLRSRIVQQGSLYKEMGCVEYDQ